MWAVRSRARHPRRPQRATHRHGIDRGAEVGRGPRGGPNPRLTETALTLKPPDPPSGVDASTTALGVGRIGDGICRGRLGGAPAPPKRRGGAICGGGTLAGGNGTLNSCCSSAWCGLFAGTACTGVTWCGALLPGIVGSAPPDGSPPRPVPTAGGIPAESDGGGLVGCANCWSSCWPCCWSSCCWSWTKLERISCCAGGTGGACTGGG
eukprot:6408930-Prymnesium_polylepis.3